MFWVMTCRHGSDTTGLRDLHRDAHRQHVATGGGHAKVLIGSALLADDGTAIGHFGIIEAESRDAAQAFAENDPFARAGLVTSIELVALPATFQAHRIDPMTRS